MRSAVSFQLKKCIVLITFTGLVLSYGRSQSPNIIYIMTDDMGYGDLSSYGCEDYKTPNIDKLVSQGMRFINAYSAGPLCTPTRTAFMTGRYPARTTIGLIEPLTGAGNDTAFGLTSEYPSIASFMKGAGYETALIGKWHLGFLAQHSPIKNGFDYFFGMLGGATDYISHMTGLPGERKHDLYENDLRVYPEGYLTELLSQKAVSFIKEKHDKPFFLSVAFNAPHWPWIGPNDKQYHDTMDFRTGGSPETYAAMMKSLDDAVGNIMREVDSQDLSENTIVIFTNDNGGERYSNNGGFFNGKTSLWEGGIRVPAVVRWTGKIVPGSKTSQAAITMDWTATILSAAGAQTKPNFPLDGVDLMPILHGKKKNIDRTFYWRTFQRIRQKAVRDGMWKYLQDENGEYLFNLAADHAEAYDLKDKEKTIFDRLKKQYAEWEKSVLPPIPLSN